MIKSILILIVLCCFSCKDKKNKFEILNGPWAIEIIEYNEEYLLGYNEKDSSKLYFAPGLYIYLEKGFYLIDKSRQEKSFYRGKIDAEMIDGKPTVIITESDKQKLNGIYQFQIDTISSSHNFDELRLYLYSDSIFITAIKSKVKLFNDL